MWSQFFSLPPFNRYAEPNVSSPSLPQVESIANRGGFGSVPNVDLHAARRRLRLVMAATAKARPPGAHVAQLGGRRNSRERETEDALQPLGLEAVQYMATSRLRVTASLQPG